MIPRSFLLHPSFHTPLTPCRVLPLISLELSDLLLSRSYAWDLFSTFENDFDSLSLIPPISLGTLEETLDHLPGVGILVVVGNLAL